MRFCRSKPRQDGVQRLIEPVEPEPKRAWVLHHIDDACDVAEAVDSPAVRLIFDTAHVQAMDGDVVRRLETAWDRIAIVQLADTPGRIEPGAGVIDFAAVLGVLKRREFRGLVELEFGWAAPGPETERAFIERLRRLDAAA